MQNPLFCMPLKAGVLDEYKSFMSECLTGAKQEEYKKLLLRYEIHTLALWLHTIEGRDYAFFMHDMSEKAPELLAEWTKSSDPFDQWFKENLEKYYDIESMDETPPQPIFFGGLDARKS